MRSLLAKRIFDICLSFFGLIASLPTWLMISVLIYIEDKGPIYYTQDRIGKNGKIFKVIKFRSMQPGAEEATGPIQAKENDERATRIGRFLRKTALDELPQLLNILKGDMSFVGPRALRPTEIENRTNNHTNLINRSELTLRNSITPGLTGIAQVFAARDALFEDKLKYDISYVKNQNMFLDMYLMAASYFITFSGKWGTQDKKI